MISGYENEDLFKQDAVEKQMTITYDGGTITNELLHTENFELSESLCSESELRFGCCEASTVKFRVSSLVSSLKGKWLTISETLNGDTDNPFTLGTYKVDTEKLTADRSWRDVTAYDAMYDIINSDVADWYNEILPNDDSTCTLKEFRDSFAEHFGLTQTDAELVNDSMTVTKTISITATSETGVTSTVGESMSGKDVLASICEINGCFAHINRKGELTYIYLVQGIQALFPRNDLYPADDLYPRDDSLATRVTKSYYKECTYEDFITSDITKLQIRQEENDIGVIIGDGDNSYIIEDNFLVYGKGTDELTSIAQNIYNCINGIIYRPFECTAKGNPCLEVGDAIRLTTTRDIIESYIFQRTLKGIQALTDTYTAEGVEEYSEQVNSIQTSIKQIKGKANILSRTIEETQSQIVDVEKGLQSSITQNAESIKSEVTRATTAEGNLSSSITQTAESIKSTVAASTSKYDEGDYKGKIDNYGYGAPSSDLGSNGQYYLDQDSGKLYYKSNGTWTLVTTLTLISENLQSSITQTATTLEAKIEAHSTTYDTIGYTITYEEAKDPDTTVTSDMVGQYWLNSTNGKLYYATYNAAVWNDLGKFHGATLADYSGNRWYYTDTGETIYHTYGNASDADEKAGWSMTKHGELVDALADANPPSDATYTVGTWWMAILKTTSAYSNSLWQDYTLEQYLEDTNNVNYNDYMELYELTSAAEYTWEYVKTCGIMSLSDMASKISQNAQSISLTVQKDNIISSINQSAEEIAIEASKISLNGAVSANNNVVIDTDGKITCVGATLNGGTFLTETDTEYVKIADGTVIGGYVSSSGSLSSTGKIDFGTKLNNNGAMAIRADRLIFCAGTLAIGQSRNASSYTTAAQDYDCAYVVNVTYDSGTLTVTRAKLKIRNGIICNDNFDAYETPTYTIG